MTKHKTRNGLGEFDPELLKNAIHVTQAFHFTVEMSLRHINSGMLGYKTDKDGNQIKDNQGRLIPIKISRATFFKYKKHYSSLPVVYQTLRQHALEGYAKLLIGFGAEIQDLHRMSAEILFTVKDPMKRLHVISLLVTKILPTQHAFADMLKSISDNMNKNRFYLEEQDD